MKKVSFSKSMSIDISNSKTNVITHVRGE